MVALTLAPAGMPVAVTPWWHPASTLTHRWPPPPSTLARSVCWIRSVLGRYHSCCARGQRQGRRTGRHLGESQSKDRTHTWAPPVECTVSGSGRDGLRCPANQRLNHTLLCLCSPSPSLPPSLQTCACVCQHTCVRAETGQEADCISCRSAGSQMPLYRTPTSEIHPQEWRLHLRRLAGGHRALSPSSHKRLSVRLASSAFSLDNLGCIVLIFTGCLGADGGERKKAI